MRVWIKFFAIYIIAILNAIILIVVVLNPNLKIWWDSDYYYHMKPGKPSTWLFNKPNQTENTLKSIYRANNQRTGTYYSDIQTDNKVATFLSQNPINFGIHTASKASPVVNDKYIITVSDFGQLSIYQNNGMSLQEPLWTFMSYVSPQGMHSTPLLFGDNLIFGDYAGILYSLDIEKQTFNWIVKLGGSIGASPSLDSSGFIYVSVETPKPEGFIAKVNAVTGNVEWVSEYFGEHGHSSTALSVDEKTIVFGANNGYIYGMNTSDGDIQWSTKLGDAIKSSPAILNDVAYVASWDSHLYAINISDGRIIWKTNVNRKYLQSSFAVVKELMQGVIYTSKGICKFNLIDGKEIDCFKTRYKSASGKSSPVVTIGKKKNSLLILSACKYNSFCIIDFKTMKLVKEWSVKDGVSGEAKVWKDKVYFVTEGEGGLIQI